MKLKNYLKTTALLITSAAALNANVANTYETYDGCEEICCPTSCGRGFVYGDFLYLRAVQNGLDYCFNESTTTEVVGGTTITNAYSDLKEPNFKWSPGYRVGAGWITAGGLEMVGQYTHFHSSASRHDGIQNLHWKIDYDVADLVLGKRFYESCNVTFDIFAGIKGARIESKTNSFRTNDFLLITKIDDGKQKFCGLGPVVGVEFGWTSACGLGVYADGAVSVLYGHYHNHFQNTVLAVDAVRNQFIHAHTSAYQGVLDAGIGIKWDHEFCNNKRVWVKVGFELHRYFSYNRLGDHDDLCLDGGNVGLGFEF